MYVILGLAMAIILIADVAILVRWLTYQSQINNALSSGDPDSDSSEEMPEVASVPKKPFRTTWSLVDPFLGFQAALLIVLFLTLIPETIATTKLIAKYGIGDIETRILNDPSMMTVTIITLFAQNALFVGVVAFFLKRYGSSFRAIGIRKPTWQEIALGVSLGFGMLLISTVLENLMKSLMPHLFSPQTIADLNTMTEKFSAGDVFEKIGSPFAKTLFAIGGGVLAPIGEEVYFRGFIYNCLKHRFTVPLSIVLSGAIFAAIHISPLAIPVIFLMGMFLALVYEKTKSLWVTILMHAVNNSIIFIWAATHPAVAGK